MCVLTKCRLEALRAKWSWWKKLCPNWASSSTPSRSWPGSLCRREWTRYGWRTTCQTRTSRYHTPTVLNVCVREPRSDFCVPFVFLQDAFRDESIRVQRPAKLEAEEPEEEQGFILKLRTHSLLICLRFTLLCNFYYIFMPWFSVLKKSSQNVNVQLCGFTCAILFVLFSLILHFNRLCAINRFPSHYYKYVRYC